MGLKKELSIPSPCKAVCILNKETGFCLGCYRTIEEIGGWFTFSNARKQEVVADVRIREKQNSKK